MKKYLVLVAVVLTFSFSGISQELMVSTGFERTEISPKTGFSISFKTQAETEFGVFYQESHLIEKMMKDFDEKIATLPRFYERVFYGAHFSYPLYDHFPFSFKLNIRAGVVNNESFIITPSILTDIKVFDQLSIGIGAGVRSFRPTFQSSVRIRLWKTNKKQEEIITTEP